MEIGEFQKRIMLMIGEGAYSEERKQYLGRVVDLSEEMRKEFVEILKRQREQNCCDENERLKWFIKWLGGGTELKVDEDGFVRLFGEKSR